MISSRIRKTIDYAKFFNSRLTIDNLYLWLISPQNHSLTEIRQLLRKHPSLKKQIISKNNKSYLKKLRLTNKKTKNIQKLVNTLSLIPTIRLIALTGSLSVDNPKKDDDIDLMIITSPNTLWLTRPLAILIVSVLSSRRKPNSSITNNQVCINLWLDQTSLLVPKKKQNLYIAHEVLQIKPLLDRGDTYHQFIKKNFWVKKHLANAYRTISAKNNLNLQEKHHARRPRPLGLIMKTFNLLAFKLQHLYMKKRLTREHITLNTAYFHPRDLYPKIKKLLF